MADLLTRLSIKRQRCELVDAARTYKRLLSLGHTPEQAAAVTDAECQTFDEWRELHGEPALGEGA